MTEFLQMLATSAIVTGTALAVFTVWIKARIEHGIKAEYDIRLESHKAQLKREADLEVEKHKAEATRQLESLKSTLAIAAASRTTAFSNIYERRLNAIAAIHGKLVEVNRRLGAYVAEFEFTGMPSKDDRFKELAKAMGALEPSLLEHMLFLPKALSDRLTNLRQQHISLANRFRVMVHERSDDASWKQWSEIAEYFDGELKASMEELEAAMRATLDGEDIVVTRIEVDTVQPQG